MTSWLERYNKRQEDLARGVDAELVRGNRRRFAVALGMLAGGAMLAYGTGYLPLSPILQKILVTVSLMISVAGLVLLKWAGQEQWSLDKPDPEEPPSILKK